MSARNLRVWPLTALPARSLYSPETNAYRFMSPYGGYMLNVTATVAYHTLTRGYDAPYGRTWDMLDFTSAQWRGTGELSRDHGQTWNKRL